MNCIFCKIITKEIPSQAVFENDAVFAFHDIKPKAPVHVLIVPKKHIVSVHDFTADDRDVAGELLLAARLVAEALDIPYGYRLAFNVGRGGGQVVDHVHMHLLAWPDGGNHDEKGERKEVVMV